ncbi:hypothetical protein C1646_776638 [Rhizophagus diaphanus]|nr:hypothetical protein C1646_776638 [Rhizophagus diaphanus] [Rhizophagus sp. MUCL 43196]
MARALVEKASKLSKPDNSPVRAHLDFIAYKNTVEIEISFEVTGYFDIVIVITNIATPVHVEVLAQMLYRICDCSHQLESIRLNNLSTAIKGHCEWDNNAISYKIDKSPAVITFIEVEHQKCFSARYFIEKLCSLIAICNEVKVEALVIKKMDFNTVATSRNLDPEEAENLKFNQKRSIPDTMALKCYDEKSAMKGLEAKDIVQWKDTYYKATYNSEKSVAEDLHKSYSANHWKIITEFFQILGFTGIDDKRILSSNIVSETFTQSCKRFIKLLDQSLLLFGFKSHAKITSDLNSAIRAINAIAENWCGYTIKINRKKIGPKEKQVWENSYQINQ